jgi:hypothetical protein
MDVGPHNIAVRCWEFSLKGRGCEMEFGMPKVKGFRHCHVPNFEELGFKVGAPPFLNYNCLFGTPIGTGGVKPCKNVILDHSWNGRF